MLSMPNCYSLCKWYAQHALLQWRQAVFILKHGGVRKTSQLLTENKFIFFEINFWIYHWWIITFKRLLKIDPPCQKISCIAQLKTQNKGNRSCSCMNECKFAALVYCVIEVFFSKSTTIRCPARLCSLRIYCPQFIGIAPFNYFRIFYA